MKATLDIPDDLYRRVKARSAMEGRPLRAVAMELFQQWLALPSPRSGRTAAPLPANATRFDAAVWTTIIRPHLRPGMNHDLAAMNEAIAEGWGRDAAKLADPPKPRRVKS